MPVPILRFGPGRGRSDPPRKRGGSDSFPRPRVSRPSKSVLLSSIRFSSPSGGDFAGGLKGIGKNATLKKHSPQLESMVRTRGEAERDTHDCRSHIEYLLCHTCDNLGLYPPSGSLMGRKIKLRISHLLFLPLLLSLSTPAKADWIDVRDFTWKVTKIFIGAAGSFALHEACHLAVGKALGAKISTRNPKSFGFASTLVFGGLSDNEDQVVAISGNACTGILAEIIVRTRAYKKSDLAWGAAAFHTFNAFAYAGSTRGDAKYWVHNGGRRDSWQILLYSHSSRVGLALAVDSKWGQRILGSRFGHQYLNPNPVLGGWNPDLSRYR